MTTASRPPPPADPPTRDRGRLSRSLPDRLAAAGFRWTRQRQAVLDIVRDARSHLDAEEVYRIARRRDAQLSLSTVYRTLHFLRSRGAIRELRLGEGHFHYEMEHAAVLDRAWSADPVGRVGPHHSHLICRTCGAVVEFGSPLLDRLRRELEQAHGFAVDPPEIEVTGTCQGCLAAASSLEGAPADRATVGAVASRD